MPLTGEKVITRCKCGGGGWIDEHTPCCDHPELMVYYICCSGCTRQTTQNPTIEDAKKEWIEMNVPEGCLVVQ
jgi:hypothetical protein